MATKLPRIAVTLSAETRGTLDKLSRLQRRPRSAIAADLLEEMQPALARIATLLEAAIKNRQRLPGDTAAKLGELEAILGATATMGLERLEAAVQPASASEPAGQRPAGRRRRGH